MKRKDAFTDLVEHARDVKPVEPLASPSGDRQVVNAQGETITLGEKPRAGLALPNKSVPLELSETDKQDLASAMHSAINEALDRFLVQLKQKKDK